MKTHRIDIDPMLWTPEQALGFLRALASNRRSAKRWIRDWAGITGAEELSRVLARVEARPDYPQLIPQARTGTTSQQPVEYLVAMQPRSYPAIEQAREYRDNWFKEAGIYRARRVE